MKNKAVAICLFLALLLLAAGCQSAIIREDTVQEMLPVIDPEAGVAREVEAVLYYQLDGEATLVGVAQTITVRAGEHVEHAIVRQLLEGPSPLSQELTSALPEDVRFIDAYQEGRIVYVTFSREMLRQGTSSDSHEELEAARRMSVYAVVNSLCSVQDSSYNSVQIRVDLNNNGEGLSVPPSMLGFSETTTSSWLEPMGFEESVVATPEIIAGLLFSHLQADEHAAAYPLFAESETGGMQKPDYATMETELKTLGRVDGYTIHQTQIAEDQRSAMITADITWTPREGTQRMLQNVTIQMLREGELYKMGYQSLLAALRAQEG